ncbi:hypothetical protein GCM10011507_04880 [Edaphobacter acidisoli]|uniref:MFS transporter n=1 Tax=Edaphobacter acidisoli TaxID=2040573 RepID=A0A916RHG6_9BACT|nr:MFS transporter [Edaphobacter acidisoli]GGA56581.1 hypothetical protein GCM10011507_04880 [Edaphobacter acidisoli]
MTQLACTPNEQGFSLKKRIRLWLANAPRGQFWLFFVGAGLFNFGFSVFFFLFNLYLLDLGMTERTLGVIGSLIAVGSIAGTIPFGVIAQRFGLRHTLTVGVLLTVTLSILRTCIVAEIAQFALAICIGLTLCFWAVCLSPSIAALTTEQERPIAFSLIFASGIGVTGLGSFTAGRLPGLIQKLHFTSLTPIQAKQATLLFACVGALVALIPISGLTLRPAASEVSLPRFSNPFLRKFLPAIALWSLVTGSFAPFANVYFVHHMGFSLERAGAVMSSGSLAQFIAVLAVPLLFRKAGLITGVMLTQFSTAFALGMLAFAHGTASAAAIYWIYVAAQNMNEPGIYSLLMDRIPVTEHNGASAATFFVSGIAQAVASLTMGTAIVRFGYSPAMLIIAVLAVAAGIVFRKLPENTPSTENPMFEL